MSTDNPLFEFEETNERISEWRGMPEFHQPNNAAYRQIIVSFEDEDGIAEFAKLVQQNISPKTKSIWFPDRLTNRVSHLFYYDSTDDQHPDA